MRMRCSVHATDSRSRPLSDHPHDKDQDDRAYEAGDQITDPAGAEFEPHKAEQPTSNSGPYNSQHDVHQEPHVALHKLLGKPASNSADHDGGDPTDFHVAILQRINASSLYWEVTVKKMRARKRG